MTHITVYEKKDIYLGVCVDGHSGYAEAGEDIVCAGISALTLNFINSVEQLTEEKFTLQENQSTGRINFRFVKTPDRDAQLFMKSLVLGLEALEKEYTDFISLDYKEV